MRFLIPLFAALLAAVSSPASAQVNVPIKCTAFSGFPLNLVLGTQIGNSTGVIGSESVSCSNQKIMAAMNTLSGLRGQPGGIATLGDGGLLPLSQFPAANTVTPVPAGRKAVDQGDASDLATTARAGLGGVQRTVLQRLNDAEVNVLDYGPIGKTCVNGANGSDDAAALTNAMNAAIAIGGAKGGVVRIPRATCAASVGPVVPAHKCVLFQGEGAGASTIRITGPTSDGITFNNDEYATGCGGLADMTLEAGAGFQTGNFYGVGSSGYGVKAIHMNAGWSLRNVDINNFVNPLAYFATWNTTSYNVQIKFYTGNAILIDKGPIDGAYGAGNKIYGGTVSNNGFPDGNRLGIALRIRASGGEFFDTLDLTSAYKAVVVDPRAGDQVFALWFKTILADTALSDGWTFDATQGKIISVQCTDCWAGFNGNPLVWDGTSGKPTAAAATGGHGVVLNGPGIHGLRSDGFRIRENGLAGVLNNAVGSDGIEFHNASILKNSQITDLAYQGVVMANGAGNTGFFGGRIGNPSGEAGSPKNQSQAFLFNGAHDSVRVIGVDTILPGPGTTPIYFANEAAVTSSVFSGNLPRGTAALNSSEGFVTPFGGAVPAGATKWFEPAGPTDFVNTAPFWGRAYPTIARRVHVDVTTAPGAGQTFTYQMAVNGALVGNTGTISGGANYSVDFDPGASIPANATYEVRVVGSAGAAASAHRGRITVEP